MSARHRVVVVGIAGLVACGDPQTLPCEERDEEVVELPRVSLVVGTTQLSAEVADDDTERDTAWAGRLCGLDALLWVADAVEPPALTLCGVEVRLDLAMVRDGEVIAVQLDVEPCQDACEACPTVGGDGPAAQAVLWTLSGVADIQVGDAISGLDAVELPTAP